MSNSSKRLIWIDLEMTGLDTFNDSILEIATVVTDADLEIVAEGPNLAIYHDDERLDQMDSWKKEPTPDQVYWTESDHQAYQSGMQKSKHWIF